jgi:hypothetical protein
MPNTELVSEGVREVPRTGNGLGPRTKPPQKVKRLNINLPEKTFNELERLADESGRTMTELVRVAIGLVQVAIDEESHGRKLAVVEPNGKLLKEILLLR